MADDVQVKAGIDSSALASGVSSILPAGMAEAIRGGGQGGEVHVHLHNLIGERRWFDANRDHIMSAVQKAVRNAHQAAQGI
jgi:hypothetical protein